MRIVLQLIGFNELFQKFSPSKVQAVTTDFRRALLRGAVMIEGEAKRLCPVDTGTLRRSITHTMPYLNDGHWQVDIGTNVEYAPFVEFGTGGRGAAGATKGQSITPTAYEAMSQMGYQYGGGKKRPGSAGMGARPFLFPAFEKYRDIVPKLMLQAAVARMLGKGPAR